MNKNLLKTTFLVSICILMLNSVVIAEGADIQGGSNDGLMTQKMAQDTTELKEMIQERTQEMAKEMEGMSTEQKNVYQNQNNVRTAVHTMLASENLVGSIGKDVSRIAKEFNNSVQSTIKAEESIQTRNMFVKFFFGGDEVAASEIEKETSENQERIQELKQLISQADCDEEVKATLQEQIRNIEQEQTRLKELAQKEKQNKGLFGWMWK